MKTFTDAAGRTWTIALNVGTAVAVKDSLGVDLLQPEMPYAGDLPSEASAKEGPPLLTRLGADELLLGEVLCGLLAGRAGSRGRRVAFATAISPARRRRS